MDTEVIMERALGCWRRIARESGRIELYVKVSDRRRVEANDAVREVHDAGVAVRLFDERGGRARFGACVGSSDGAIVWAAREAHKGGEQVCGLTPDGREGDYRSTDLDPMLAPAEPEELREWVRRDRLEWIEAGTTTEILIGPTGWVAQRRRQRIWWRTLEEPARILAKRVTTQWEPGSNELLKVSIESGTAKIALLPDGAAPIVAALAARGGEELPTSWVLTDEPSHPEGLVGGRFDDAGFPTKTDSGGCLCRRSFRDPPEMRPTNQVLRSTDTEMSPRVAGIASRARVIPLGPEDWVVELDLPHGEKRWFRGEPAHLAQACCATFGAPRVTADGPIVPGIIVDTQRLSG